MLLRKTWQRTALWLGIGWSLLWSIVLVDLPLIQQLDLYLHDRLICFNSPRNPPSEIAIAAISQPDIKTWELTNRPATYSQIADRLLDAGAAVVVLNLLPSWVQNSDHTDNPIKNLAQNRRDRLVLVLPTSRADRLYATEWRNYEYFLPATIAPESVLGFSEYEPEARYPQSDRSTARQASLFGEFTLSNHLELPQSLGSAALLAIEKFKHQKQYFLATPIQIHFWGKTGTFPRLDVGAILKGDRLSVRDKIVLVGFSDPHNPDAFAVRSPFGELMPAVELQANLVASLLTRSFTRIVPLWWQYAAIALGGIFLSKWVVWTKLGGYRDRIYRYWLYPALGAIAFGTFGFLLSLCGWLVPIILPLVAWIATVASIWISLVLGVQRKLIYEQQCEIDRLQNIEKTAVISQTRKLMHRLASDIHDGPLQELKIIMDRLELLQMQFPQLPVEPLLDRVQTLATHLHEHLNRTRAIAFTMTPELREGLDSGIKTRLQQLIESGELKLKAIQNIQPLAEPSLNSAWLEAREDIYRFFNEAIHNVIRHAQPPEGNATQVSVSLEQQGDRCCLIIENDGDRLNSNVFEPTPKQRQKGGYGTKLMDTIAAELPQGAIARVILPEGGLRVELSWSQNQQ